MSHKRVRCQAYRSGPGERASEPYVEHFCPVMLLTSSCLIFVLSVHAPEKFGPGYPLNWSLSTRPVAYPPPFMGMRGSVGQA